MIQKYVGCCLAVIACFGSSASAGEIYADFPSTIDAESDYVIYSHGLIVEGDNTRPVHERWGVYDFPAIKQALANASSFKLIAYHRPENAKVADHVQHLDSWVKRLTAGGVRPEKITLMGFSRGGEITALASSQLKPLAINTILLATCWPEGVPERSSITLSGRFLSIFETTDFALTCTDLATRSKNLSKFDEVAISTGKGHGAFYRPQPEWIDPVLRWMDQKPTAL